MPRLTRFALCFLIPAILTLSACASKQVQHTDRWSPHAKNVIVMIADGSGYDHLACAGLYLYGKVGVQACEDFPVRVPMTTYSTNTGGYDAVKAWSDFEYARAKPTDSAAAATAMATGVKTYNGAVGVGPNKEKLENVVERAESLGKSTGVVTTVFFCDATPACFVAHNPARHDDAPIAQEMIQSSSVDVIMGCGNPYYTNAGVQGFTGKDGKSYKFDYVGGEETWKALVAGTAGSAVDADHNGVLDDAWTLIQTREQFQSLGSGPTPKRVIGIPQTYDTIQERRPGDRQAAPYAVPRLTTVPTLAEMARGAINVLDKNPKGFFVMIEGGAIDWASHDRNLGRMIEERIDFDNAVNAVMDWVSTQPDPDDTLVIVTSDHETGYLTRQPRDASDIPWAYELPESGGIRKLPLAKFNSGSHTNSLVPLFATGNAASEFRFHMAGNDPHRGEYTDNTAIAKIIFDIMK